VWIWTHSQGIYPLRVDMAQVLGLPESDIIITHAEGAGCYGHNAADDVTLDAVLLALPYALGDLEVMNLGEDPFSIVYPAGHEPAANIADENLLLLEDGHCLRDQALAACELEGARRNAGFNGTSLHTLAQMVANGLGVTLMPRMALDAGILRGLDVTVRPLTGAVPHRRIGLVWRRSSARTETFRALAEALREELKK